MYEEIRESPEYHDAKEKIRVELKRDNVESIYTATGEKARLIVNLRVGKPLIYRGKISIPLFRFIEKKRYCKDEMPKEIDNYVI
jgi:hypothetical protein